MGRALATRPPVPGAAAVRAGRRGGAGVARHGRGCRRPHRAPRPTGHAGRPGHRRARCCSSRGTAARPPRCRASRPELRQAGRDVTVVDLPDRAQGDLTAQADALGTTAAAGRSRRTGARSVDVVGYSAGGVVARLWATEGDGAGQDPAPGHARVATARHRRCAARHPGVRDLPDRVPAARARQPGPARAWTTSRCRPACWASRIWTTSDDVVQPPTSSVEDDVPSPSVQSVCAASQVNHGGLPNDRVVQAMVARGAGDRPDPDLGARGLRPAQLVTSWVVKFAQAATSSTPT